MSEVFGYVYRADTYCPDCIFMPFFEASAKAQGIDLEDEYSYDSDVFPKPVFAWQYFEQLECAQCGSFR